MSKNKFQIGDRIRVVSDHETWLDRGQAHDSIFTAAKGCGRDGAVFCERTWQVDLETLNYWPGDFELVGRPVHSLPEEELTHVVLPLPHHDPKEVIIPMIRVPETLGVHRPALEDRKVGKVGMHMVIDGFPRALREVARVMTWAGEVKGYKLNDWVNLPNAEIEFPAAEYRHQNDNSIMKSEGTPAIERTDHESNLLHAAHKVFNSLAELELILQGRIK